MFLSHTIIAGAIIILEVAQSARITRARGADKPLFAYDPNTTKYCSWWHDNDGSIPCEMIPESNFISLADFMRWNPVLASDCQNFRLNTSYCVEVSGESTLTTTATKTTVLTTTRISTGTATTTGNGISTPSPYLPGSASNCDVFDLVKSGETCDNISRARGVSYSDFLKFNPGVGIGCTSLWLDYFVCVSTVGHSLTTLITSTTTSVSNGISTPSPYMPGSTTNCDIFDLVKSGETCDSISRARGVSYSDFIKFNPQVGSSCTGLWLGYYVCVSVIGHSLTTVTVSPTKISNGISTPTPIMAGMVSNCRLFDLVKSEETCASISVARGVSISISNILSYNPGIKSDCSNLWLGYHICVALI